MKNLVAFTLIVLVLLTAAALPALAAGSMSIDGFCRLGYAIIVVYNGTDQIYDGSYTIVFQGDPIISGDESEITESLVLQPGQEFRIRIDQRERNALTFYVNFTSLSFWLPQCNHRPNCSKAYGSVDMLWSPDHDMYPVTIEGVRDPDHEQPRIRILAITLSEDAKNQRMDANTAVDYYGVGTNTAWVRAERMGSGKGRVYTITFRARDGHGEQCRGTVDVTVAHDAADVGGHANTTGGNGQTGGTVVDSGPGNGNGKAVGHTDDHGNPHGDTPPGQNPPTTDPAPTAPTNNNGNGQTNGNAGGNGNGKAVGKNK